MNPDLAALLPALLPRAIAWAKTEEQAGLAVGTSLSAAGLELARIVGVRHPEKIRVCVVDALPLPRERDLREAALQAGLLGPGMAGLTLGHTVFVRSGHGNSRLLRHEFRHVYQCESAGSIDAFLPVYLAQIVQFGYEYAPLEQDARAHEAAS